MAIENRYKNFTDLILSISRQINKIKDVEMEKLGFKGGQVQCIFVLYESGSMSFSNLCKACGEDKGALSRTIKSLTDKGIVECENANKKYKNPISLTESGLKIGQIVNDKIEEYLQIGSAGITQKERQGLYESLQKINSNLQNYQKVGF